MPTLVSIVDKALGWWTATDRLATASFRPLLNPPHMAAIKTRLAELLSPVAARLPIDFDGIIDQPANSSPLLKSLGIVA